MSDTYCHRSRSEDCYCDQGLYQAHAHAVEVLKRHAEMTGNRSLGQLVQLADTCLLSTDEHMRMAGQEQIIDLLSGFILQHQRGL